MKAELIGFLVALQQYQHQIVMACFLLSALIWIYCEKIRSVTLYAVLIYTSAALSILAVFAYVFAMALYLRYPNYRDHALPSVASISWLWMQGHDLYPNWTAGKIYG